MQPWLPLALFALAVWSAQRVVTKMALTGWSTAYFYRLTALASLAVYLPFALLVPFDLPRLPAAFGLSLLMALTFYVTTEATKRGPVGLVAPLTAMSPALTVALALIFLGERLSVPATVGIALALVAAGLLAYRPVTVGAIAGWLPLALGSLALQGVGAFLAKLVVTGSGPTNLLVMGAGVQLAVGLVLARREPLALASAVRGRALLTSVTLVAAAVATIGYLSALSSGPVSLIVPLVATSPAIGGLVGIIVLREATTKRQLAGAGLGVLAAAILAMG